MKTIVLGAGSVGEAIVLESVLQSLPVKDHECYREVMEGLEQKGISFK